MEKENFTLDRFDRGILQALQQNGRASNVELSERVHLSAPQCFRRVRQLEQRRVIKRYAALVDAEALGFGVTAFVSIALDREQAKRARRLESLIKEFPEIVECYTISGEYDYLLKVVARDLRGLSELLTDRLMQIPGVAATRSTVCLETIKPLSPLPVGVS
ncbi:MAG TPA: Lrp/AsnC family transcriptional regulator [Burkholderiaceae bacterium]|jgi:Lrp/AsnC family transcriptional regulator, leucine-responsive regulatory protein|nr:Lrp/AsnC family transcriptional regulator [Burkholderiaceae bacterium]